MLVPCRSLLPYIIDYRSLLPYMIDKKMTFPMKGKLYTETLMGEFLQAYKH